MQGTRSRCIIPTMFMEKKNKKKKVTRLTQQVENSTNIKVLRNFREFSIRDIA